MSIWLLLLGYVSLSSAELVDNNDDIAPSQVMVASCHGLTHMFYCFDRAVSHGHSSAPISITLLER